MSQLLGSRKGTDGIWFLALGVGLGSKPTFSEIPFTLLQRFLISYENPHVRSGKLVNVVRIGGWR